MSRKSYPKQFSKLMGEESLFQASVKRTNASGFAAPLVVTGNDFRFTVLEQMAAIEAIPSNLLIEPDPRNTAPAILAAALVLAQKDPGPLMLVAPSDHVIPDAQAFREAVAKAVERAELGDLVTFGIRPTRPETGYGWLELAQGKEMSGDTPHPLVRFVEKPELERATSMLEAGNYLWNAGIFLFKAETLIEAFREHAPELLEAVETSVSDASSDLSFTRLDPTAWSRVDNVSIDYAIMEKSRNLTVMPYSGEWSDLGGWDAVWAHSAADETGTVCTGEALAIDCTNTLLRSESERVEVVGIGLEDIIVVAMPDAVLVAHKDHSQDVKKAVASLKEKGSLQAEAFPFEYRPWGMFESLIIGSRFQVKRIVVKPGAALSLQSHHHRSEHWIVVEGTAKVTVDSEVKLLTENQSVYIPLFAVHRLENPGKVPLTLIEVQTGSYLGEDDIIRYEDVYARKRSLGTTGSLS
jgi:mannose-1-phosphate guanylyltransferase / mannose-6-phosphate isomerase